MAKKHISLSAQVSSLCLGLTLGISVVLLLLFTGRTRAMTEKNLRSTAELTMRYVTAEVLRALETPITEVKQAAAVIHRDSSPAELEALFAAMFAVRPETFDIYYVTDVSRFSPGGFMVSGSGWVPEPDWDPVIRDWFQTPRKYPGEVIFSDPYIDAETNELCITLSKTVSIDGVIHGVVAEDVLVETLVDIVSSRKITADGQTVMIDGQGLYLAHPDSKKIMEKNIFSDIAVSAADVISSDIRVAIKGNTYICSAPLPVRGVEWYLVSSGSIDELMADSTRFLWLTGIIALVITVVAAGLAFFVSRTITAPFKRLAAIFAVIAGGDLTVTAPDYRSSEASLLSDAFNHFAGSIKSLIAAIGDRAENLTRVGNDLSRMMTQSASAVNQINATMEAMKSKAETQAAGVNETNATMSQVVDTIASLTASIEEQSNSVSRSQSAAEKVRHNGALVVESLVRNEKNIHNLTSAAGEGHSALLKIAEDLREIDAESARLLEINQMIKSIAGQTNLLSMNAAIEAAHAGEIGKGFAVVADEVRKLAESSSEQAKMVATVLKKIKSSLGLINVATAGAVSHFERIDESVKTVSEQEARIRNAAAEQNAGNSDILETVAKSGAITQNVRDGSETMLAGSREVITEARNLENLTADMLGGIHEIAIGMGEINQAVNSVREMSGENQRSIEELNGEVAKFKIA